MPEQRVVEQVLGILTLNDVKFLTPEDKKSFLIPYGSAGVYLYFGDWSDQTLISLRAYVLSQVDVSDERRPTILREVNRLNHEKYYGKTYLDEPRRMIVLEYDLLGDYLEGPELMTALGAISRLADEIDEPLREAIGTGVTAKEAWDAEAAKATEGGASGPVVSA